MTPPVKRHYVRHLISQADLINEPFLLHDVVQRRTRDDRPYLLCTLQDKSGKINGVFWNVPEDISEWIQAGQIVLVTGRVDHYKDTLQINATDLNLCLDPDLSDFLPASQRGRQEMVDELRTLVDGVAEPWQGLLRHILLGDAFLRRFANAPAARMMHHAYVGGLLEHTLSMARLAQIVADHYDYVNKDLLVTGALLHDAGKVYEYEARADFAQSEDGRLVGHIVRAVVMIEQAAGQLGTIGPDDLRQLTHLVAAHHGQLEWGSPVPPRTLEAILLHQIDLLDSRVQGFFDFLAGDDTVDGWSQRRSPMHGVELQAPPGLGPSGRDFVGDE